MAVLLQIRNAHKSFADQIILDNAEATITDDRKVGFIGRNGAGKSTLLKILLGDDSLDSGEVIRHPNLSVGYLRQHDPFEEGESALDFLMRDSDQPEWRCGQIAGDFELKGEKLTGPVKALSGGWQTRVKLAALLLHDPKLLLLDEPTNFLDLRTQILLENFLRGYRGACLIVSHDRAFLSATCEHTLSLDRGKLTMYPGKIEPFLEYQKEQREHDLRVNATTAAKQKQLEKFINKNRAKASTASQARSKQKQLDRLSLIDIESAERTAHIQAPNVDPRQGIAVRCEDVAIGYPEVEVASNITLEIDHGQRVGIVGDNGQGKTTLLRTLVGSLETKGGNLKWGHHCRVGTYAQHVYTSIPESETVIEYLENQAIAGTTDQQVLAVAGALLFRDSHVKKKVKVLSGGERARLCLAGLLLSDFNILVLDEPGTHLDVETVEALAKALEAFKGTVIFTSHDRHFMKRVATAVIEVRDGSAKNYLGDYDAYVWSINQEIDDGRRDVDSKRASKKDAGEKPPKSGKSFSKSRKAQKEIRNIEKLVAKLDQEKKNLNEQLLACTDASEALVLHDDFTKISEQLEEAESKWLELTENTDES
jgi:ATP-binding cassette subfamily F protein 3